MQAVCMQHNNWRKPLLYTQEFIAIELFTDNFQTLM